MSSKLSHYIVVSEPIDQKGRKIIFSTRTSKNVVVSQGCLDYLTNGRIGEIPSKTLEKLTAAKIIVPAEEDELATIVTDNVQDIEGNRTLYEVMQPSAMCQLGCYYCGQQHTKNQMDSAIYEKLEQRIRAKAAKGNYTHLSIGWFGAEPLMGLRQIRELTQVFKQIAKDNKMTYGAKIVTNGLSLKENIFEELAKDLSINSIEVTLDGTAEYHDSHRYTKENGKSFDLIYQNLKTILSKPDFNDYNCRITIRCNVDEKNYEGVTPLMELIASDNIQRNISNFYPIGVYSWGNDAHKKSLTKEAFAEKELVWLAQKIKNNFRLASLVPGRVKQVCFSVSKVSEMYDAFGNIFDCSEVSYVPAYEKSSYALGNLKDNPPLNHQRSALNDWNNTVLTTDKFPCHTCEMLPVCGGGCPKSWHEDMRACPTNKFNIKEKLVMNYVLNQPTKEESKSRFDEIKALYPEKPWVQEFENLFEEPTLQTVTVM